MVVAESWRLPNWKTAFLFLVTKSGIIEESCFCRRDTLVSRLLLVVVVADDDDDGGKAVVSAVGSVRVLSYTCGTPTFVRSFVLYSRL